MQPKTILAELDKANYLDTLLTPASIVGPGALISNNLEWLRAFNSGSTAFNKGDYPTAIQIFHDLDDILPRHDNFLTPAKINETLCWLHIGRYADYIHFYEPLFKEGKVYASVLWNLVIAYCRAGNIPDGTVCLDKWFNAPLGRLMAHALLLRAVLQYRNHRREEAEESFEQAWLNDRDFCTRSISKCLGHDLAEALLNIASPQNEQCPPELHVAAREEVISAMQRLLIPRAPGKSPQVVHQLSEFEYRVGYVASMEKLGDGDIDGALSIIESLLKGNEEAQALKWAKAACLLAKRDWRSAALLLENRLDDPSTPGGVLWNKACAYFNLEQFSRALDSLVKCTEREFRTSALAWLAQGLLAHLSGNTTLRNHAIKEAIKISPKQLIHYVSVLRQIGIDPEGVPTAMAHPAVQLTEASGAILYDAATARAKVLLTQQKALQAAQEYVTLAPASLADIPEIGDTTFVPVIVPTCPVELSEFQEVFLSGVAAYQRKAYEEAVHSFDVLHAKTDHNQVATVNLAASLILIERYSRAVDILEDSIEHGNKGNAHIIRNLISAYVRADKLDQAYPWFTRLLEISNKEFFNFVQMAYVADLLGRRNDVATALFNACTENLADLSLQLKGAAIATCLEVRDNDRATVLVRYFVQDIKLPYVVAGRTRPIRPAKDCITYVEMKEQYETFERRKDPRAALAYFEEVLLAREADYGASAKSGSPKTLFNACLFFAKSLLWNNQVDKAYEILAQGQSILSDYANIFKGDDLGRRYLSLSTIYAMRGHDFLALELCEKGLKADSHNINLKELKRTVEQRITRIPEKGRNAIKGLADLATTSVHSVSDLSQLLPRIDQVIQIVQEQFPSSKKITSELGDVCLNVLRLESTQIVKRRAEILHQRESLLRLERDMQLHLPKTFVLALSHVVKGIRAALEDIYSRSICPDFRLSLEAITYFRESEASLLYSCKNTGTADIHSLRIRLDSPRADLWVPALEEKSYDVLKKDGLIWIDWPIQLYQQPVIDLTIVPRVSVNLTGGSLKGETITQIIDNQETKLQPFSDISVDYPVVALRPEDSAKLFGRENLLRTLKGSFTPSGPTRIPFLEGVRKVGKTSILYFLASRLPQPFLPVYVNFDKTWTNAYELMAKEILQVANSRTPAASETEEVISNRHEFDQFLGRIIQRTGCSQVVLLLDEFHTLIDRIENKVLPREFLGDLRDIYQGRQQKVSVALADWHWIDELKQRVPAQLWTDFASEPVSFLNELDTREAILSPAQGSALRFERQVTSQIYYWTNGYPWHVQWICTELVNHLNTQKRYAALPQDVDLIVKNLLRDDRLFNEGVCRRERISTTNQLAIYTILKALNDKKIDICSWFKREVILEANGSVDINKELSRLKYLEIVQEQDNLLRFCSPLHAKWFESKRTKEADIHGDALGVVYDQIGTSEPEFMLPEVSTKVQERCARLKSLKAELRTSLIPSQQVFHNTEFLTEWDDLSVVVLSRNTWVVFIKAMRDVFVKDMIEQLDAWEGRRKYPDLYRELNSVRERRNLVEHAESVQGREEEERSCLRDIGKRAATSSQEWVRLQVNLLDRMVNALEKCLLVVANR